MRIKTGDKVRIMRGKDKGKEGTIIKTFPRLNKVIVKGANLVKKHQKSSNSNPQGGIIDKEAPLPISNVMLLDPESNKPTRIGIKVENNKKIRISKKSGKEIN